MKKTLALAAVMMALGAAVGLTALHEERAAGDPTTAPNQPQVLSPLADRVVLIARSTRELRFALAAAEATPNIVVSLVKDQVYELTTPIRVRGRGTILKGNGAIVEQRFSYSGQPDPATGEAMPGIAVLVNPKLGPAEPWSKDKDNGFFWMNKSGTVGDYAKAAGAKDNVVYQEPAPNQYPGPLLAKYTVARKILVPAENVTIEDLVIRGADPGGDVAMMTHYARDIVIRNVRAEGKWRTAPALGLLSSEHVLVDSCAFSSINLNSSNFCRVTRCTGHGVSFEEMVRWCDIDHNTLSCLRSNDITCEGNRIAQNRFVGKMPNFGSLALPGSSHIVVIGNVCDDSIWLGGDTKNAVIQYNIAARFDPYAGSAAQVTQRENSWQPPATAPASAPASPPAPPP